MESGVIKIHGYDMVHILVIGDPHFTATNTRETDCLTTEVQRIIKENDDTIRHVVILGDTLDRHETVNTNVLFRVEQFFNAILETRDDMKLYVLIGNHDIPNNKIYMSEVHPFKRWEDEKLHIINKTREIDIDDMKFLMVPYVPPGRFREAIEGYIISEADCNRESVDVDINKYKHRSQHRCIFAHQEFKGCKMGTIISEHGDNILSDIDIISGHIHERQRIGRLYYPGTPYQTNMGETTDKSISLLEFLPDDIIETRFSLNIPRKITIDITASQLLTWIPPDTYNRYRLIVHGNNTEFLTLSKNGIISMLTHKGIKISYKEIKIMNDKNNVTKREKLNFMDIFMSKIYDNHEMKDELIKICNLIYK